MFSLKGFVKRENNVTMAKNVTILKAMRNICSLIGTFFLISLIQVTEHKFAFSLSENN